ncbi:MAG: hypothetical protein AAF433_02090 [Bacteroidota bacterium]
MKSILLLSIYILCTFYYSCNKQEAKNLLSADHYTITNTHLQDQAVIDDFFELRTIEIAADVYQSIGVDLVKFVVAEELLLLADMYNGKIQAVNFDGTIAWQLAAEDDNPYRFPSLMNIEFDDTQQRVGVYSDIENAYYWYDLEGDFIEKEALEYFFTYRSCQDDCCIFDSYAVDNRAWTNAADNYGLIMDCKGVVSTFNKSGEINYSRVQFSGYDTFTQLDDQIFFRRSFFDSIYSVDFVSGEVNWIYNLDFERNSISQDIAENQNIQSPLSELMAQGAPMLLQTVRDQEHVYSIYRSTGGGYKLSIIDNAGNNLVNSAVLTWGGLAFSAPILYSDGWFLTRMKDYEFTYWQQRRAADFEHLPEAEAQLQTAYEQQGDNSGAVLVLLRVKN